MNCTVLDIFKLPTYKKIGDKKLIHGVRTMFELPLLEDAYDPQPLRYQNYYLNNREDTTRK